METFAGIGAQHKAIKNISKKTINTFKVIQTSEWDARAIIAYSLIHYNYDVNKVLKKNKLNNEEKLNEWLLKRTFSLNSKTSCQITRKPYEFKKRVAAATIIINNNPDINQVIGEDVKNINLLTYSFPCQGLSVANMGRGLGISQDVKSTSNLIHQIGRILSEAKTNKQTLPKYLLMENVNELLGKKHKSNYDNWINFLENDLGYKTFTYKLRSDEFGMVQTRKRVFAISILKPNKEWKQEIIETIINKHKKILTTTQSIKRINSIIKLKTSNKKIIEEFDLSVPNDTTSRRKMAKENKDLTKRDITRLNTLTTKQDRHPNIGMINYKNNNSKKLNKRFITPREAYQIMGFESKDFDKVRPLWLEENILTKESLYRQAGNSIAVKVLEAIFLAIDEIEKREND